MTQSEPALQEPMAVRAVLDLLRDPPADADALFDLVEQRPVLLGVEAEEVLSGLIAQVAARERDEPPLAGERRWLERLRRVLRDCRLRGVDAVRRTVPAEWSQDSFPGIDKSQLGTDQVAMDWREGTILLGLGRLDEAVAYLKRAVTPMHERGWHALAADTEMLLWEAVRGDRATGDTAAALVHATKAAAAYRKAGDRAKLRHALTVLAIDSDVVAPRSARSDHYRGLLAELDADLATWLREYVRGARLMFTDPEEGRAALQWCVDSIHLVGAEPQAQAHWRDECARKLAFIDDAVVPETTDDTAVDQFLAAILALKRDRPEEAADRLRRAVLLAEQRRRSVVTEVSHLALSVSFAPLHHLAAVTADRAGTPTEALDLVELNTSRSQLARLTTHRLWRDAGADLLVLPNLYRRQAVRYLTDAERGGTGERQQLDTALHRLREALAAAEHQVLVTASAARRAEPPVPATRLAEHLGEDDVVLVYAPIGVVYAVTRGGVTRVADFDTGAVERWCADYRRLASTPDHDDGDPAEPAADLEAACVDPVRATVAGHRRVLVVPNEPLWGVPLGALGDRPLDTDHLVSYVPSLSVLDHLLTRPHVPRRVERFVGIGDPDGSLPHAAGELADAASRFYDRTVETGAGIDVEDFRADLSDADVVHIASHGIAFDEFPDLSALHVAGTGSERELLWAPDLVRLSLRARLVVLAACHAGLSKALPGNEYVGLPGVFLVSGARAVLGPLWQVDDRVTARLMAHFHEVSAEAGPAGALRHAQRAVRSDPATAHPFYWAAFQLFGLP
ncbi:CHAT domain-containing protein [Saccharothrix carnea]|uniref:CHAT domain-containing protein n=1 Tax=Saccharothrix carnea TaxID=1280637 RepID=A0A2P8HII4_SACCR|nr:CHAT domain-containing protein [Saccharothrix carnea]PSL45980.1 CHAT domain-containing protein [Saccharothrix carnea]